jgi:hypothetical protein
MDQSLEKRNFRFLILLTNMSLQCNVTHNLLLDGRDNGIKLPNLLYIIWPILKSNKSRDP